MKRVHTARGIFVGTLAIAGFAAVRAADLSAQSTSGGPGFEAELQGAEEVPPVVTETSGAVDIHFNPARTQGAFELILENGERVTQAHIHCAPRGVNGPIIIFLAGFHDRGWDVDGNWVGDAVFTDENIVDATCGATLREIVHQMFSGNTYVNVHSVAFPAGVVRGQLRPDDD